MQTPLELTFRGMTSSPAVESLVQRWIARLERDYDRIQQCAVVLEVPHQHSRHGNPFHVRISLAIPGHAIEVSHERGAEDALVTIADAFRAARRQLHDHVTTRNDAKRYATAAG